MSENKLLDLSFEFAVIESRPVIRTKYKKEEAFASSF